MRKWNFSAGPATIPESVLKETQSELLEFKSTGMSVMEMSHRSKDYGEIANAARDDLIELLEVDINSRYKFPSRNFPEIFIASQGEDSGIIGAAALAFNEEN